ncbi:hypothetical protein [Sinomonas mesophila]|uniref:hypothetical protein n=1 Tax=Sinomonas mesophila TaxID=1531955 RepID=UPI0009874713|nr:hypothetical protein [Sinomonas mesophila]
MSGPPDDRAEAARRLAAGPQPSGFRAGPARDGDHAPSRSSRTGVAPYDPLRLCVYATIALLGWLAGPAALVVFAAVGFAGYLRARRAGLTRSKCVLRDTRLVLTYLAALTVAGLWGVWALVARIWGG